MNILYCGTLGETGTKLCNYLSKDNNLTAYSDAPGKYELECKVYLEKESSIGRLMNRIAPDAVLCFETFSLDMDALYDVMTQARESGVRYFCVIREAAFFRKNEAIPELLKLICQSLETESFHSYILECSALYGEVTAPAFIKALYKQIQQRNVLFPEDKTVYCDCIHIEDLCSFLSLMFAEYFKGFQAITRIQSCYPFKLEKFMDIFIQRNPQVSIMRNGTVAEDKYISFSSVSSWKPEHDFMKDINDVFESIEFENRTYYNSSRVVLVSKAAKIISFIIAFVGIGVYQHFIKVSSELQFVDFRLLLILCTGLFTGKKNAVFAAVLCSISSVVHSLLAGVRWYIIFYHINNWIPITVYFIAALLAGAFYEEHCSAELREEHIC